MPAQENAERTENENQQQQLEESQNNAESEPLVSASESTAENVEPPVSMLTVMRTFVISFVASIIPDHAAMWENFAMFLGIYLVVYILVFILKRARNSEIYD